MGNSSGCEDTRREPAGPDSKEQRRGASDLARRVNVSRQTIYAIEAGTYVPNTEVALNLARELEVTVDELFSLQAGSQQSPESLAAEVLSATAPAKGQPVRICQIGSRWVSVPVSASPYYMPEADGIIKRAGRANGRADLVVFAKDEAAQKRLVLAGCDPATGLLARMVEKISGVEIVSRRRVEQAGAHLAERREGSHRRFASGGSEDRRIQSAFHPQTVSRTRISAWSRSRGGRKDWSSRPEIRRTFARLRISRGRDVTICESRARLGKPRAAG